MPRMRLSLRWKIFSGCILLTVLILLVNFFQTRALLEKTAIDWATGVAHEKTGRCASWRRARS